MDGFMGLISDGISAVGGLFSDGLDAVGGFINDTFGGILDSIGSAIIDAITSLIGKGLYYLIDYGLLSLVNVFYQLFAVFAGISKVTYINGRNIATKDYLVNIFFTNSTISNIYWCMALIGMCMAFAFAIISVIKKLYDVYDKQQKTLGMILTRLFKSIVIILLMSFGTTAVLNATNVLMQAVNDVFTNADSYANPSYITFTSQQYATMARVLNTIGNYSLNDSYNSRYNLNSCFNEIRSDLYSLQDEGVFDVSYVTKDASGNVTESWQSVLQRVANSADLSQDVAMDVDHEAINRALLEVMDILKKNSNLRPLESYTASTTSTSSNVSFDRILFLMGTTNAARNPALNQNPYFTDSIRGPFYSGTKSMYNLEEVMEDFAINVGKMKYVTVAVLAYFTLKNLWRCIIACVVRLFSIVALYIVAPPFIATMPLDDGEKFKQWMQAFIVQCFGIFGTVIPMRLLLIFVPTILSSNLILFSNPILNIVGKALMLVGGLEAVDRFSGMITGILTNQAGMEALRAGNTNEKADAMFSKGVAGATAVAKTGASVAFGAARFAADVTGVGTVARKIGSGVKSVANFVAGSGSDAYNSMRDNYGILGAIGHKMFGGSDNLPPSNAKMGGEKDNGK